MYQSPPLTPSGRRSSTPLATAFSAIHMRRSPSAPRPRRRSHSAATASGASCSFASTSANSTKSFSVPWPLAKITCSGYVPPGGDRVLDDVGVSTVEPADPVIPTEPRPLATHVTTGADERRLARRRTVATSFKLSEHLCIPERP